MRRTRCGVLFALAALAMSPTISAGGWAVITVEALPDYINAGEPVTFAYSVRQHGHRLLGGLAGRVEAKAGTRHVAADARPGKHQGQYVATLTLPSAADWSVTIHSGFGGFGTLALLPLRVVDASARPAPLDPSRKGEQLFVAKGCATCHGVNGKALPAAIIQGPALVPHKYQADYLARVLANPALLPPAVNPGFRMPNLDLDPREIEALVAFINHRPSS